jgi:hypothetical protein
MTPKFSLIVVVAVTALAFGVPTALAESQLGGPAVPDAVAYFYANERATLGFGPVIHDHGDATQAKLQLQSPPMEVIRDHGDATQAKLQLQSPPMEVIRDHGDATQAKLQLQSPPMEVIRDHGDAAQAKIEQQGSSSVASRDQVGLDPNSQSAPTVSASSGSSIEWPQLGIGFGLGILLAGGAWFAMRITKGRALAH